MKLSNSKIAKTHGTTVAELKRLNGFDDARANKLIMGEVIKVPSQKPNAVNEDRSRTRSVISYRVVPVRHG